MAAPSLMGRAGGGAILAVFQIFLLATLRQRAAGAARRLVVFHRDHLPHKPDQYGYEDHSHYRILDYLVRLHHFADFFDFERFFSTAFTASICRFELSRITVAVISTIIFLSWAINSSGE